MGETALSWCSGPGRAPPWFDRTCCRSAVTPLMSAFALFGGSFLLCGVIVARLAMSHIYIYYDRRCTVGDDQKIELHDLPARIEGTSNGRLLPPSRTQRRSLGLAARRRVPRCRQL